MIYCKPAEHPQNTIVGFFFVFILGPDANITTECALHRHGLLNVTEGVFVQALNDIAVNNPGLLLEPVRPQ
jgi:hypothetical protein